MAIPQSYSTYMTAPKASASANSVLPTILTFHGSGSNADPCHTVQLARLNRVIKSHFQLEHIDAPFICPAGPGILPFFADCGPYKRWLPNTEKVTTEIMRAGTSTNVMASEVESLVCSAVHSARARGSKVIGLIGFSQGTKVVAGLLKGAEIRRALGIDAEDWLDFSFGLSVCASYPPPLIPPSVTALLASSHLSTEQQKELLERKIETPTFHVQGKQDEFEWAGRALIEGVYKLGQGRSEVVTWDIGHVYPLLPEENEKMRDWMLGVVEKGEGKSGLAKW